MQPELYLTVISLPIRTTFGVAMYILEIIAKFASCIQTECPGRIRLGTFQGKHLLLILEYTHSMSASGCMLTRVSISTFRSVDTIQRPRSLEPMPAISVAMKLKPYLLVFAVYVALAWRFFRMISRQAVNVFYSDQWDFNDATLFEKHTLWEVFRWQYGPQRHGLGGVAMKLLEPSIRWNSRYEAYGIGVILLVAALLALYLKARLFGPIGYADVVIPAFFLTPAQFEIVIGATNPGWSAIPLLLIILNCLCWTISSSAWKYFGVVVVNFLLVYTGYGIFMGLLTPAAIAIVYWRTKEAGSAAAFWISIASLLSFFLGYQPHHSGAECFTVFPANPVLYAMFMSSMFGNAAGLKGSTALVLLVGAMMLVVSIVSLDILVKRLRHDDSPSLTRDLVASILIAFCLIFMLGTAYGRLCLGMAFATMPRYVTYTILGLFGLYLFSLSMSRTRLRALLTTTVCLIAVLSSVRMSRYDAETATYISNGKRAWRDCYLQLHDVRRCDAETNFQIYPEYSAGFQRKLDFLEQNQLNLFDREK